MNYFLLLAILLWGIMVLSGFKICYDVIKHHTKGSRKDWALIVACGIGSLISLKFAADFIVKNH